MGNAVSDYGALSSADIPEAAAVLDEFAKRQNHAKFCRDVIADSQRRQRVLCQQLLRITDGEDTALKTKAIAALAKSVETEEKARRRLAKFRESQ